MNLLAEIWFRTTGTTIVRGLMTVSRPLPPKVSFLNTLILVDVIAIARNTRSVDFIILYLINYSIVVRALP